MAANGASELCVSLQCYHHLACHIHRLSSKTIATTLPQQQQQQCIHATHGSSSSRSRMHIKSHTVNAATSGYPPKGHRGRGSGAGGGPLSVTPTSMCPITVLPSERVTRALTLRSAPVDSSTAWPMPTAFRCSWSPCTCQTTSVWPSQLLCTSCKWLNAHSWMTVDSSISFADSSAQPLWQLTGMFSCSSCYIHFTLIVHFIYFTYLHTIYKYIKV